MRRNAVTCLLVAGLLGLMLGGSGCGGGGGGGSDPDPVGCGFVPGQVTSSVGGPQGAANDVLGLGEVSSDNYILFNNINLTFVPRQVSGILSSESADLGGACLDDLPPWSGGTTTPVTALLGGTYMVRFVRTFPAPTTVHLAAFTVEAYSGGVVTYTWVTL